MINQLIGIPLSYLLLWRLGGPEVSSRVVKKINDNNRLFWEVNKTSTNDWLVAVFLTRRLESNTRQMTRELTLSVQANRRYVAIEYNKAVAAAAALWGICLLEPYEKH